MFTVNDSRMGNDTSLVIVIVTNCQISTGYFYMDSSYKGKDEMDGEGNVLLHI